MIASQTIFNAIIAAEITIDTKANDAGKNTQSARSGSQPIDSAPVAADVSYRTAQATDAGGLWKMVCADSTLEANSPYAYVLMATHFQETCWIAEQNGELAGFVAAYHPPTEPDAVFVWQVCSAPQWRGHGIGTSLLQNLVRGARPQTRYLTATVTPDNQASEKLFRGFARRINAPVQVGEGFPTSLFPDERSQPEMLFRIGPF